MLVQNKSEARRGHNQHGGIRKSSRLHDTEQFVVACPGEGRTLSFWARATEWCCRRYVGRIDAGVPQEVRLGIVSLLTNPAAGGGKIIKSSRVSDVCRVQWGGLDLVVKRYNHSGLLHSLRHGLKGSRARRSWINGHRLLLLGIRTPRPVAYVDEYRGPFLWQSWLITEYVNRPTLHSVLRDKSVSEGRKRRMIHQVLRLMDRLGSPGINHGDMKHTNLLCDGGQIVLTDLDGVEIHRFRRLHRQRCERDVARFLRAIAVWQEECDAPSAARQAGITTQESDSGHSTSGSDLLDVSSAAGRLWMNPAFRSQELEEALPAGSQALIDRFDAKPVRSAPTSRVHRFAAVFRGERMAVFFKEYLDRSVWDRLKHLVRPNRAMRSWRASQMLGRHGFHVPEIIAVGSHRAGRCPVCFMATREVADAMAIYRCVSPDPAGPPPFSLREKRESLRELGLTIGRMHAQGIVHGDLRPGNILIRRVNGRWEFFFLDNERTGRPLRLWNCLRLKNLVQINMLPRGISRTDRLRFFHSYMITDAGVCLNRRRWAAAIMRATCRRLLKKGWTL